MTRAAEVLTRFVSTFTGKLDAKGRISIPAPFRAVLAQEAFEGLYVVPAMDQPALDCGGKALLAEIDAMIAPLSARSPDREALVLTLLGESAMLKMDSEGRITLTDALKTHAGIAGEVSFVGAGPRFQIWEPERFRRRLLEARQQALALRNRLGSRKAATGDPLPPAPGARE